MSKPRKGSSGANAPETEVKVLTVKDIAMQFAGHVRKLKDVAKQFFDKVIEAGATLDKVPEEMAKEAMAGFRLHWENAHPAFHFERREDKSLHRILAEAAGCVTITGKQAMAYTPDELGELTQNDRPLSETVKRLRKSCNTVASNNYARMLEYAKPEVEGTAQTRKKDPPRKFVAFIKDVEETIWKYAKAARKRGDGTVPTDKKITSMVVALSKALEADPE